MGYKAGMDMLLKVNFGLGGGFVTIGGIVTRRLTIDSKAVDVTNQGSERGWAEMLAGVAPKSVKIAGDGQYAAGPIATQYVQWFMSQQGWGLDHQVVIPGLGTLQGPFVVNSLEFSGQQSDVMKFSIDMSSSGVIAVFFNVAV